MNNQIAFLTILLTILLSATTVKAGTTTGVFSGGDTAFWSDITKSWIDDVSIKFEGDTVSILHPEYSKPIRTFNTLEMNWGSEPYTDTALWKPVAIIIASVGISAVLKRVVPYRSILYPIIKASEFQSCFVGGSSILTLLAKPYYEDTKTNGFRLSELDGSNETFVRVDEDEKPEFEKVLLEKRK